MKTSTFIGLLAVVAVALLAGIYIGAKNESAVTNFTSGAYESRDIEAVVENTIVIEEIAEE